MPTARPLDPENYESDEDGLPREVVRAWAPEKHLRLRRVIGTFSGARRKYIRPGDAGATYIELFCGPGRCRVEPGNLVIDGSPLVAWREADARGSRFTAVHISDADSRLVEAARVRLERAGAPVQTEVGEAAEVVDRVIARLDPYALHFAFLDPYGLKALPFEILRKLAALKRMDMLIHVSVQGLQRGLKKFVATRHCALDDFAPSWRTVVDPRHVDTNARMKVFEHWRGLLGTLQMEVSDAVELVRAEDNQPLYWLAFAAHHPLPIDLWQRISRIDPQMGLFS